MALKIGDVVDGWTIVAKLGEGLYSPVWHVQRDGYDGALKVAARSTQKSKDRLLIEADALARLDHDAIPSLLEFAPEHKPPYLVMSLVGRYTLLDRIVRWDGKGRVHGETEALGLVTHLARAIQHVHSVGLVHRDIKDANLMLADGQVWLIDFGLSKEDGSRDQRVRDSFLPTGAARFSPLSKLDDSLLARKTHDIYALGVVAYRLLTGEFPYGEEEDPKALRTRYETLVPASVREVNRLVSPAFSKVIDQMITHNDDERIDIDQVVGALEAIRPDVEGFDRGFVDGMKSRVFRARRSRFPRVFRDPVRGDIRLSEQEYLALGTPQMQRLRWIRQLGLTNLVYPGADHSRLSHSLGTLHTVETMMRAIADESGIRMEPETRTIARLYALTHDITHIAFGHTIEDQLGFFPRHDENVERFDRMLGGDTSEIRQVLSGTDEGKAVLELLDPVGPKTGFAHEVVSGTMGADVLDYIDRDAYFCGLDHRVDSAIYRQLAIDGPRHSPSQKLVSVAGGRYGPRADRTLAIHHLLNERYAMFLKVYTNNSKIAADALLGKALSLMGPLDEAAFEQFGDETLLDALIRHTARPSVAALGHKLKTRQLPHGCYRANLATRSSSQRNDPDAESIKRQLESDLAVYAPAGRLEMERRIADAAGVPEDDVFVYVPRGAPGYQRAHHWVRSSKGSVQRETADQLAQQHLRLWELWVFSQSDELTVRRRVAKAAKTLIGLENLVPGVD